MYVTDLYSLHSIDSIVFCINMQMFFYQVWLDHNISLIWTSWVLQLTVFLGFSLSLLR